MRHRRRDDWIRTGVLIADEVDTDRIASDVEILPGCRLQGKKTSIGPGCVIGAEAPATVENCQLGRNVELRGGYYAGSVFLEGSSMGSGAHIRAGTLLEEEASGAHSVGLKQTVLLPFVTLGSLINFCDILMAGGTSRRNHSEVGSSYIHFNFTPHQDKATASLIGDVPDGVFLDRNPVFLGGQGGLVGPSRITYGTVVAAGGICRQDVLTEDQLHVPADPPPDTQPYSTGVYHDVSRIVDNCLHYIGNQMALREWYRHVRQRFMGHDPFDKACLDGALKNIDLILKERVRRLGDLAHTMDRSLQELDRRGNTPEHVIASQRRLRASWDAMELELKQSEWGGDIPSRDTFLQAMNNMPALGSYIETIQSLEPEVRTAGSAWLESIVNAVNGLWPAE